MDTIDDLPALTTQPALPASPLFELGEEAARFARQTSAPSTRKAYAKDWIDFSAWCTGAGLDRLPAEPETVGLYLASLSARLAVSTLGRRLAAIATAHRLSNERLETRHPAIRDVLRGIRREQGIQQRRVAPATTAVVAAMAASCDHSMTGLRDRALLLLGFAAALRRSELVALQVADIATADEGLRLTVARSKTDQADAGTVIGVVRTGTATCPVTALHAWLGASGIREGRIFRAINRHGHLRARLSDQSIALIVKQRAVLVGLDASAFSGHSLRAGLATAAAANGVEERIIQRQTRHRSVTVLRSYIRDGEVFVGNASGRVGL